MSDPWVKTGVRWRFRPTGRGGSRAAELGLNERQDALSVAPLFAALSKRHLRDLARVSGVTERPEGATVVKEGASGSVFYVILDGAVKVVRKGRTIARLRRGEFFGEMSLLDGQPRVASVVTEAPSRFLTLSAKDFRAALDRDPALARRVLREMALRLREREKPPAG
ncbi:MAG TPA: cyclic nucleotide-binding domain-containing protein [Actinomycetota bacterium]|nr:cyclic nucleotide-binding domain-containing protein [Actinomycetota bacterium]